MAETAPAYEYKQTFRTTAAASLDEQKASGKFVLRR